MFASWQAPQGSRSRRATSSDDKRRAWKTLSFVHLFRTARSFGERSVRLDEPAMDGDAERERLLKRQRTGESTQGNPLGQLAAASLSRDAFSRVVATVLQDASADVMGEFMADAEHAETVRRGRHDAHRALASRGFQRERVRTVVGLMAENVVTKLLNALPAVQVRRGARGCHRSPGSRVPAARCLPPPRPPADRACAPTGGADRGGSRRAGGGAAGGDRAASGPHSRTAAPTHRAPGRTRRATPGAGGRARPLAPPDAFGAPGERPHPPGARQRGGGGVRELAPHRVRARPPPAPWRARRAVARRPA